MLEQLRAQDYKLELRNNNIINIKSEKEITDEIIEFIKENKKQLIHEIKKEKAQAIKQLESEITNQIKPDTYLNVEFEGVNKLVAVCRPEDEEHLQKQGLLTLTTYELALLTTSKTSKEVVVDLLKIKSVSGGKITDFINA